MNTDFKDVAATLGGEVRLQEHDIILVSAGQAVDETDYDLRRLWTPSRAWFRVAANQGIHEVESQPNPNQPDISEYVKRSIKSATTVSELAAALTRLPQAFDWACIDLCIGTVVDKNSNETTAAKLWECHLSRWKSWLRAA